MHANAASPELSAMVFRMVDQRLIARATHADTSARRSPSAKAPCNVSVHKGTDPDPLVLPGEVVGRTGLQNQVPGQP
eukprot:944293-Alexandrium_andersonii.AAC.1